MEYTVKVQLGRVKVAVLRLDRIIVSKKATGRDKDRLALKVLADAMKTIDEKKGS
jgi:hypothetical protein